MRISAEQNGFIACRRPGERHFQLSGSPFGEYHGVQDTSRADVYFRNEHQEPLAFQGRITVRARLAAKVADRPIRRGTLKWI
jgi:hypothetical protein